MLSMNLLLLLLPPHPLNLSERFREAKCQPHKGKKTLRDGADGPDGADEDGPGASHRAAQTLQVRSILRA